MHFFVCISFLVSLCFIFIRFQYVRNKCYCCCAFEYFQFQLKLHWPIRMCICSFFMHWITLAFVFHRHYIYSLCDYVCLAQVYRYPYIVCFSLCCSPFATAIVYVQFTWVGFVLIVGGAVRIGISLLWFFFSSLKLLCSFLSRIHGALSFVSSTNRLTCELTISNKIMCTKLITSSNFVFFFIFLFFISYSWLLISRSFGVLIWTVWMKMRLQPLTDTLGYSYTTDNSWCGVATTAFAPKLAPFQTIQ